MQLFVLGATGRTGREIVEIAAARGHRVTAYVRSPQKLEQNGHGLVVTQGDVLEGEGLSKALVGHDAVLSALGLPASKALRPSTFMTESAASTVAAMKRANVHRLAIVSAAVLFPASGPFYRFFRWVLHNHALDLSAMETVVQTTDLDWTIARPPRLVHSSDEQRRVVSGALPAASYSLSFRALATFLVDCVEGNTHRREVVGIAR